MPFNVTLVKLLAQLAGAELSFRREADLFGVSALVLPEGRQVLVIERIYRDGTGVLLDPTPEEVGDRPRRRLASDLEFRPVEPSLFRGLELGRIR